MPRPLSWRGHNNPKNISFFSIKHKFWARIRNVSERRFFYVPKTCIIIDSYGMLLSKALTCMKFFSCINKNLIKETDTIGYIDT